MEAATGIEGSSVRSMLRDLYCTKQAWQTEGLLHMPAAYTWRKGLLKEGNAMRGKRVRGSVEGKKG
jgi:hypothetical protein